MAKDLESSPRRKALAKIIRFSIVVLVVIAIAAPFIVWKWLALLSFLILAKLVLRATIPIPAGFLGHKQVLGARTPKVFEEGPCFVWPGTDKVALYDNHRRETNFHESFPAKDGAQVIVEGRMYWMIDKDLLHPTFSLLTEEDVVEGLKASIKGEIGHVISKHTVDECRNEREALRLIINVLLRLKKPPYLIGEPNDDPRDIDDPNEIVLSNPADRQECKNDPWLFYTSPAFAVKTAELLAKETKKPDERSRVELLHGIDIVDFAVADVAFSEDVTKSLEARKIAAGELDAAKDRVGKIREFVDNLVASGMSADEAAKIVEPIVNHAVGKQIVHLAGTGGALPVLPIGKKTH